MEIMSVWEIHFHTGLYGEISLFLCEEISDSWLFCRIECTVNHNIFTNYIYLNHYNSSEYEIVTVSFINHVI
jgi:hypothetical protein